MKSTLMCSFGRATDEARTRGLHLGKVALYQLSYYRIYVLAARCISQAQDIFCHNISSLSTPILKKIKCLYRNISVQEHILP